ncbi:MAG: HD domain-containing protein [Tannerella sp.]|jgi:GTP pyrophosphokinase|nr:HD domain-containing protein [Tannerella sp.]
MNTEPFFTPDEKREFFSSCRVLMSRLESCLERDDVKKMKAFVRRVAAFDCYGRDRNGINGLLRNIRTAVIAASDIGLRRTPVIALLLYRPVYMKIVAVEEVRETFGDDVALIITRLLKTSDLYARNTAIDSENFHHLLFSFAEDVRVILIMIADRLCMMRMGRQIVDGSARLRLATEVSYLYAPLAHRLGLYRIKSELEDLSLKYIDPDRYNSIKAKLNETKRSREAYIAEFIDPVRQRLRAAGLAFEIRGRTKSIHSISSKMKKQQTDFEGIYDLFAIRVILDSQPANERSECWQVFSIITDMYQPNPGRMRDWISVPKSNGYESLHITVLGPRNRWVEVQIRTRRMDEIAERGLAAHWKYKGLKTERGLDDFMNDVRALLENPGANPADTMRDFRMDMYQDEIYVFTPTGELIKLSRGATVLDFAFAIHSKLGSRCISGRVNGRNVPIRHTLGNGDTVEILTSPQQHPKQDWLAFAVTSRARTKIRQALREEAARTAEYAKELLQRRLRNRKIDIDESQLMRYIKRRGFKTVTDFYLEIAEERLDVNTVIEEYLDLERRENAAAEHPETRSAEHFSPPPPAPEKTPRGDELLIDIHLTGIDYTLAKCCNPIFGDEIFGFVSTQGIKIHRRECPNAPEMFSRFGYRILPARWNGEAAAGYAATLRVIGHDDIGIVTNISSIISRDGETALRAIHVDSVDGLFQGDITVTVRNTQTVERLIRKIREIKGVKQVSRLHR